jgi:hypothetical protein
MKNDPISFRMTRTHGNLELKKQTLFDKETLEIIWSAAEDLTSPELEIREHGFEEIISLDIVRRSPLVAYLIATRLLEPELRLRSRVVRLVAALLNPKDDEPIVAGAVQSYLLAYLSQMRTRQIFALLQVAAQDPDVSDDVAVLLKACSFAGNQLSEIMVDHEAPLSIRRQAVKFTSKIGFLVAIPALERMVRRIEARYSPQNTLPGLKLGEENEASLLPYMKEALVSLRSI